MSENPNKTKVISLRLSDENEKILQGIEEATGKSKSDLMEDYLQDALELTTQKRAQLLSNLVERN